MEKNKKTSSRVHIHDHYIFKKCYIYIETKKKRGLVSIYGTFSPLLPPPLYTDRIIPLCHHISSVISTPCDGYSLKSLENAIVRNLLNQRGSRPTGLEPWGTITLACKGRRNPRVRVYEIPERDTDTGINV